MNTDDPNDGARVALTAIVNLLLRQLSPTAIDSVKQGLFDEVERIAGDDEALRARAFGYVDDTVPELKLA